MLSIIVVVAVVIIVFLYLIYSVIRKNLYPDRGVSDQGDTFASPEPAIGSGAPNYLRLALYFFAVVISLLFVLSVGSTTTSNPGFCGKACHSMNSAYQSWRRSAHAQVNCVACHTTNSIVGDLIYKADAGVNIFKELTGAYRKPVNASSRLGQTFFTDEACLRCHSPQNRRFTVRQGLNVTSRVHIKHLDAELKCVTCHNRIAHPRAEIYSPVYKQEKDFAYQDNMRMEQGCWRCHKRGGLFRDSAGKVSIGPYLAANGAAAPTACKTCHNPDWDKRPETHKADDEGRPWKSGLNHGIVARDDYKSCQACHDKNTWCSTRCHKGITIPHISGWRQIHSTWAKADRQLCNMCHQADPQLNFCDRCHHDEFRKQFKLAKNVKWKSGKKQHGIVVKATGGQPCWRCHEQSTWCTRCHWGIVMPHQAGWKNIHFNYVKFERGIGWLREESVCAKCHNYENKNPNFCFNCHHQSLADEGAPFLSGPMRLMRWARGKYGIREDLRTNTTICSSCHGAMQFCRDCHDRNADRAFGAQRKLKLEQRKKETIKKTMNN